MPRRRLDRVLQAQAVVDVAQEEEQRPLVLAVAPGRAERQVRRAVAQHQRGCQRGPRPLASGQRVGQPLGQPEHLAPGRGPEPEARHHRRALQPAAAWGGRHHVAEPVNHVQMAGVAAEPALGQHLLAHPGRRRECVARACSPFDQLRERRQHRLPAAGPAGPQLAGGTVADQLPPLVVVLWRQQFPQRDIGELRVAVPGFPVGERQLGALGDRVHKLRSGRVGIVQVEPGQQGQLLGEHRSLTPRPGLAHRQAPVAERQRLLHPRPVASHVVAGEQPAVGYARDVHDLGAREIVSECLGHEPLVERPVRRLDLPEPVR